MSEHATWFDIMINPGSTYVHILIVSRGIPQGALEKEKSSRWFKVYNNVDQNLTFRRWLQTRDRVLRQTFKDAVDDSLLTTASLPRGCVTRACGRAWLLNTCVCV